MTVPSTVAPTARAKPARLGDRRGLTALGAVLLTLLLCSLAGAVDVVTGPGLRVVFAIAFLSACLISAIRVHREDLAAVVVMPPLVYAAVVLLAGLVEGGTSSGSLLLHQAIELFNGLVLGAPVLLAGTALAAVIALVRRAGR